MKLKLRKAAGSSRPRLSCFRNSTFPDLARILEFASIQFETLQAYSKHSGLRAANELALVIWETLKGNVCEARVRGAEEGFRLGREMKRSLEEGSKDAEGKGRRVVRLVQQDVTRPARAGLHYCSVVVRSIRLRVSCSSI